MIFFPFVWSHSNDTFATFRRSTRRFEGISPVEFTSATHESQFHEARGNYPRVIRLPFGRNCAVFVTQHRRIITKKGHRAHCFWTRKGTERKIVFQNFLKRGLARRSDRQKKLFFLFFLIGVSKTGRRFNYTMFDRAIRTRPIRQARAINQSRSTIFDDDSTDPSSDLGRSISLPLMNFVRV